MRLLIRSRGEIEAMSQTKFPKNTALISITDTGFDFAKLVNTPDFLLQIAFDDVDNDVFVDELRHKPTEEERRIIENKYNMFSDEQASLIASFYLNHKDQITTLICQCEHGQSRSAAVAAAILEFKFGKGIVVFADDRYYPNKFVFKKVLKSLKSKLN